MPDEEDRAGHLHPLPDLSTPAPHGSVLVLGSGELGMAILRALTIAQTGFHVSVLVRPGSDRSADTRKQKNVAELRSLGVNLVFGDLAQDSQPALTALFKEYEIVIGCTGFAAGRNIQLKLARAVLAAGVRRYVPWQFGVDYDAIGKGSAQDLFDEQLEVRELLRAQDRTEWIIISTGMFMSFLFEPSFGVVDLTHDTVHALGSWDNAVTVTTAQDIGRLTAEILLAQPRIGEQIVYTAGDTLTYQQIAELVERVLDRKVRRELWSVPMLNEELRRDPDNALRKYRVVFAQGRGVAWPLDQTFNFQRSLPVTSVEQWVQRHLSLLG